MTDATTSLNQIGFPTLRRITIHNFSLYKQDIDYQFNDGINLVIGGNGMGKTTFINILKYALIGAYRSHTRYERTYRDRRIIRRQPLHDTYFRNRMKLRGINDDAWVELSFNLGDTNIVVKRSLFEHRVVAVTKVTSQSLLKVTGTSMLQRDYDKLLQNVMGKNNDDEASDSDTRAVFNLIDNFSDSLQYKYEEIVKLEANLESFDAFIFFVINMFIFDEDRSTIFWEDKTSSDLTTQESLTAYLLSDISMQLENLSFDAKYYDSRIRHKSEDRKPLLRLLKDLENKKETGSHNMNDLIDKKTNYLKRIAALDIQRIQCENEIKNLKNREETLLIKLTSTKSSIEDSISDRNKEMFGKLHDDYTLFLRFISEKHVCPFCKASIDSTVDEQIKKMQSCFYCGHEIVMDSCFHPEDSFKLMETIRDLDKDIRTTRLIKVKEENRLIDLDKEVELTKSKLFQTNKLIRNMDRSQIKDKTISEANDYNLVLNKIREIELEIDRFKQKKSGIDSKLDDLNKTLSQRRIDFTQNLSNMFTKYAELFLTSRCTIKYDKSIYNPLYECYIPIIDGIPRYSKDELSESQSFFMEQAFRLSFLDNFYRYPTFFIFETPDSSLDIAFSKRAADTLLQFLDKPNCLIVTFNYGNSDFLTQIKSSLPKSRISVLDMMLYGYQSEVQTNSTELAKARERFMEN